MRHLLLFESFINTGGRRSQPAADGRTDSPQWFNRYEINYVQDNSEDAGFGETGSNSDEECQSYFGTPDGYGLVESVKGFFKDGTPLCSELHLIDEGENEYLVRKANNIFTVKGPNNSFTARSIEEVFSNLGRNPIQQEMDPIGSSPVSYTM